MTEHGAIDAKNRERRRERVCVRERGGGGQYESDVKDQEKRNAGLDLPHE